MATEREKELEDIIADKNRQIERLKKKQSTKKSTKPSEEDTQKALVRSSASIRARVNALLSGVDSPNSLDSVPRRMLERAFVTRPANAPPTPEEAKAQFEAMQAHLLNIARSV